MFSSIVQPTFLPLETVRLGRFVVNLNDPHQDYFDPECGDDIPPPEVIVKTHEQYQEVHQDAKDNSFASALTRLVSISFSNQNNLATQVTTDLVKTYQLSNSGMWFRKALKSQATRKWIERAVREGEDIYLVVGFHTLVDATVVQTRDVGRGYSGQVQAPLTELLAPGVGAMVPNWGDILDPGAGASHQQSRRTQTQFTAPGEQISAIQYRKLRFKWFASRDLDKAALERDNRWRLYWTTRGAEISDVLEVDLQDDLELEIDWDTTAVGTEGYLVTPSPN
jgi:hypothetical protein